MKQAYIVVVDVGGMDQALELGEALRRVAELCDSKGITVRCKTVDEFRMFAEVALRNFALESHIGSTTVVSA